MLKKVIIMLYEALFQVSNLQNIWLLYKTEIFLELKARLQIIQIFSTKQENLKIVQHSCVNKQEFLVRVNRSVKMRATFSNLTKILKSSWKKSKKKELKPRMKLKWSELNLKQGFKMLMKALMLVTFKKMETVVNLMMILKISKLKENAKRFKQKTDLTRKQKKKFQLQKRLLLKVI